MKKLFTGILAFGCLILLSWLTGCTERNEQVKSQSNIKAIVKMESAKLRHVVLFNFKEGVDPLAIKKVEEAFAGLQQKIPEIKAFEWGLNNSPEGLDKGFTHCYLLTFHSEEDRAVYLPHPDHKAFGALLKNILEDVMVVDYWVQ